MGSKFFIGVLNENWQMAFMFGWKSMLNKTFSVIFKHCDLYLFIRKCMKIPLNLLRSSFSNCFQSWADLFMRVRVIKNAAFLRSSSKIVKFFFAVNHVIQQDLRLNPILAPPKSKDYLKHSGWKSTKNVSLHFKNIFKSFKLRAQKAEFKVHK